MTYLPSAGSPAFTYALKFASEPEAIDDEQIAAMTLEKARAAVRLGDQRREFALRRGGKTFWITITSEEGRS